MVRTRDEIRSSGYSYTCEELMFYSKAEEYLYKCVHYSSAGFAIKIEDMINEIAINMNKEKIMYEMIIGDFIPLKERTVIEIIKEYFEVVLGVSNFSNIGYELRNNNFHVVTI